MKTLTKKKKQELWNAVCEEFPDDTVMQEVHFARWIHHEMLKNSTDSEKIEFYRQAAVKYPAVSHYSQRMQKRRENRTNRENLDTGGR